jgi:hypothetical protein
MSHDPTLPSLSSDEDIARELERVAQMVRERPELNHHAADRLLQITISIRTDAARRLAPVIGKAPSEAPKGS